jgi:hypothetical protein
MICGCVERGRLLTKYLHGSEVVRGSKQFMESYEPVKYKIEACQFLFFHLIKHSSSFFHLIY